MPEVWPVPNTRRSADQEEEGDRNETHATLQRAYSKVGWSLAWRTTSPEALRPSLSRKSQQGWGGPGKPREAQGSQVSVGPSQHSGCVHSLCFCTSHLAEGTEPGSQAPRQQEQNQELK